MLDLKLYNYFRSSTSYRVRIALEIKKLKYEYIPVHLVNNGGEQNSTEYRTINPVGGVPTLEHNGNFISQSMAIIDYIDEMFKSESSLFPEDIFLKAKTRQICELINADIHPLQNLKVIQFLEKNLNLTAAQKQLWLSKWITDGLNALEITISPYAKDFAMGTHLTAADLFIVPQLFSAQRFNVDISPFKKLLRINENCLSLDSFKQAHPFKQPDTPEEFLQK